MDRGAFGGLSEELELEVRTCRSFGWGRKESAVRPGERRYAGRPAARTRVGCASCDGPGDGRQPRGFADDHPVACDGRGFPFVRRTGVVRLLRNGSTRAGLYRLPVRFDGMECRELLAFGKRRSGAFVLSRRDVGRVRRRHSGQRSAAGEGVPRSEGAVQHV